MKSFYTVHQLNDTGGFLTVLVVQVFVSFQRGSQMTACYMICSVASDDCKNYPSEK